MMKKRLFNPAHRWMRRTLFAFAAFLIFYVGSFFAFRLFRTYEFSLVPDSDPQHNLVVFSQNSAVQQFARDFYSPLIKVFPAHCYYPDRDEMRLLNGDQ